MPKKGPHLFLFFPLLVVMVIGLAAPVTLAAATPTTITAYKSQYQVGVAGAYQPSQWTDTQILNDQTSGMTFAAKQNGSGWLFLIIWQASSPYCTDQYCYGGIELGPLSNTQPMGSPATPAMMILASTSFKGGVDEFISTGTQTPQSVESEGYKTQSTCNLALSGSTYMAVCYRPFKLTNASPYDFPSLGVGSTIEIAFAVGEFSQPGNHAATDMSAYALTFSNQTIPNSGTSSSTSSSSAATSSGSSSTGSSTSSTGTTSSSTSTSTTAPPQPASPSVLDYVLELAVVVVGFTLFILLVLVRYRRS